MNKIKMNDFLEYSCMGNMQLSPDQKNACFTVQTIEGNGYKHHIWIMNTETKEYSRLTQSGKEKNFEWLDSDTIMFNSLRDPDLKKRVAEGEKWTEYHTINIHTKEEKPYLQIPLKVSKLTHVEGDNYVLTAAFNKNAIVLNGLEGEERAAALKQMKDESDYIVLDEIPFVSNGTGYVNKDRIRLYTYNSKTCEATPITDELTDVRSFKVKGSTVLYTSNRYENKMENGATFTSFNIGTKESTVITKQGEYAIRYFGFMQEDKLVVMMSDMKACGLGQYEDFYTYENGKFTLLCEHDTGFGTNVGSDCKYGPRECTAMKDGNFYFVSTIRCAAYINKLTPAGELTQITANNGEVASFVVTDKEILFIGLRGDKLLEIYSLKDGVETQLTTFNEFVQERSISTPEYASFIDSDGVEIEGFVIKPIDFDENKKYPGILMIHGGPRSAFGSVFYHEKQAFANLGYFVFYANPRGSDGRDSDFQELRGKFGTIDYQDLMEFTDHVLEKYPQLDAGRLGVTGGSYGGFMTSWIVGHTDRFKCAVIQRSVSNWITKFGTCDCGYNVSASKAGGTPWDGVEKMWWHSPLKYADKISCPIMMIYGEVDYRACLVEGIQMFTALKFLGKVPVKMRIFKGESHGLSRGGKPKHRIKRLEDVTNWFETYLK